MLFQREGDLPGQRKLSLVQEPPETTAIGYVEQCNGGVLRSARIPQEAEVRYAFKLGNAVHRHRPEPRVDGIGAHVVGRDTDGQILALRSLDPVAADQGKSAPILFDLQVALDLPAEARAFHEQAAPP